DLTETDARMRMIYRLGLHMRATSLWRAAAARPLDAAKSDLERALTLAQRAYDMKTNLILDDRGMPLLDVIVVLLLLGRCGEAEKRLGDAERDLIRPEVQLLRAELALRRGNVDEGVVAYKHAAEVAPNHLKSDALGGYAIALARKGDLDGARDAL